MFIHARILARSILFAAICMPACSGRVAVRDGQVEHLTRGDTLVVRTTGNGVWGAPHAAVELLRIGRDSPQTTFGQVRSLAVLKDGTIALFDAKGSDGPIIRLLDSAGKFIRNVSRIGEGPGEYNGLFAWVNAMPDGRLMISDAGNHRANFYTSDGKYLDMIGYRSMGFSGTDMVRPAVNGGTQVMAQFRSDVPQGVPTANYGFVRFDSNGKVIDTLRPKPSPGEFAAAPERHRRFNPRILLDGSMILNAVDRVAILVEPAAPSGRLVLAELNVPRVRYLPKEREEMLAELKKEAPEFKPVWGDAFVGGADRVWLRRSVEGVAGPLKTEANGFRHTMRTLVVFDAFQSDGTFLGEVTFPDEFHALAFVGDVAWGWLNGPDDDVYLVKYRVR